MQMVCYNTQFRIQWKKGIKKKKKKEFDTLEDTVKTKDMNKRQIIKLL